MHLNDGILLLPVGSSIKLHTVSGGIDEASWLPKEVIIGPGDDAISLIEIWLVAFLTTVQIPDDCISFSWSCDGYMSYHYQVVIVFIRLSEVRYNGLRGLVSDDSLACQVCQWLCVDADDLEPNGKEKMQASCATDAR